MNPIISIISVHHKGLISQMYMENYKKKMEITVKYSNYRCGD